MVNELSAIVEELGGKAALGRVPASEGDLRSVIRDGLPKQAVDSVMASAGLTLRELSQSLNLSTRSLQRRGRQGRLARNESDRLYRLARILALARHYIGDKDRATRWLRRPNRALGGSTPLELLDTEAGARAVENVLGRIAYGGLG
jgi:putative toxin-antitoxin system antitoxin component (TIGR02293 family)